MQNFEFNGWNINAKGVRNSDFVLIINSSCLFYEKSKGSIKININILHFYLMHCIRVFINLIQNNNNNNDNNQLKLIYIQQSVSKGKIRGLVPCLKLLV